MSSLKRCPFCGSYTGPYVLTESEAIARWQLRPNHRVIAAKSFIKKFIADNRP